jgi:hypothetical protein
LAAAIAGDDGALRHSITVRATAQNLHHLFEHLLDAGVDTLILPEQHPTLILPDYPRPLRVRLAPTDLLNGFRQATSLHRRPLRHTAILLARWPFTSARRYLRNVPIPPPQTTQLPLF